MITKPHKSCIFVFFTITFRIQKVQKWQTPTLLSSPGMCAWCERYHFNSTERYGNGTTVYWTVRIFFIFTVQALFT
jgi:hypothetical protein